MTVVRCERERNALFPVFIPSRPIPGLNLCRSLLKCSCIHRIRPGKGGLVLELVRKRPCFFPQPLVPSRSDHGLPHQVIGPRLRRARSKRDRKTTSMSEIPQAVAVRPKWHNGDLASMALGALVLLLLQHEHISTQLTCRSHL